MIEEVLLKSNYIGRDGFIWWIGQVAHRDSWKKQSDLFNSEWGYRCKVRIIGYHPFSGATLSDADLPWAQVMIDPAFGSAQGGTGRTIDLKGGETCFGFFIDGEEAQQPVVIGLLYRSLGVNNLISEDEISKEGSSRQKPFTGHPNKLIKSTQIESRPDKTFSTAETGIGTNRNGDRLVGEAQSSRALEKKCDATYTIPNGCKNNLISEITRYLQDFISFTNGLDNYIGVYIDPIINEIVDITNEIRKFSSQICGIIRLIINNLRTAIFKAIGWAYRKFVGLVVPPSQQKIVSEALKKTTDIIYCVLEKLPSNMIGFIENLLSDLVQPINAPICAIEEWTAGILANLMDSIETSLSDILSGIGWLTGELSTVSGILNQSSSLASKIYSFLDCTGLACKTPHVWSSRFGPIEKESDDWEAMVKKVNVIKGLNTELGSIETAIRQTPLYASMGSIGSDLGISNITSKFNVAFNSCNQKVLNPTSQEDINYLPIGVKYSSCIPPSVKIVGNGVGASAVPIVGNDGSIFSIEVISGGTLYTQPPTISIIDNSGYGSGATASAIIENGVVTSIYLTNYGSGYCRGEYSNLNSSTNRTNGPTIISTAGIGTTATAGIGTTATAGIGTHVVGCVENIVVRTPGYGYTVGDSITDGKNQYVPIVSSGSGAIVGVKKSNSSVCGFTSPPVLVINTSTGVGAELIPVMKYYPSYNLSDSVPSTRTVGISITTVVDCV
jgi:hypothetical protein